MNLVLQVAALAAFFAVVGLQMGLLEKRPPIAVALGLGVALATAGAAANLVTEPNSVGPIALGAGLIIGGAVALWLYRNELRG